MLEKKKEERKERKRKKNRGGKHERREWKRRTNLGAIVTASTAAEKDLRRTRGRGAPGRGKCLEQRGVINKSVNDVSGLMLLVTRSLGLEDRGGGVSQRSYRGVSPSLSPLG